MLTRAVFEDILDEEVMIHFGSDRSRRGRISDVSATGGSSPVADRPFSVSFALPLEDTYYPQGIYTIEHPRLDALELFLVPLGPGADGRSFHYEAVFS